MDLVKHTLTRLISIPSILQQLPSKNCKAQLLYKVGADGASSQSEYKVKMEGGSSDGDNDKNVFAATITILGLVADGSFIWINGSPNGVTNNRPIYFEFTKETHEVVKRIVGDIEKEMQEMSECNLDINFVKDGVPCVLSVESIGKCATFFMHEWQRQVTSVTHSSNLL